MVTCVWFRADRERRAVTVTVLCKERMVGLVVRLRCWTGTYTNYRVFAGVGAS